MGKLAGTHFSDFSVRACHNKRRFDTQSACVASIVKSKADVPLRSYKCNLCGFWHKTKHVAFAETDHGDRGKENMTLQLKCDRCQIATRSMTSPDELPDNWNLADGYHLCPECDAKFYAFLRGESIPAMHTEVKNGER